MWRLSCAVCESTRAAFSNSSFEVSDVASERANRRPLHSSNANIRAVRCERAEVWVQYHSIQHKYSVREWIVSLECHASVRSRENCTVAFYWIVVLYNVCAGVHPVENGRKPECFAGRDGLNCCRSTRLRESLHCTALNWTELIGQLIKFYMYSPFDHFIVVCPINVLYASDFRCVYSTVRIVYNCCFRRPSNVIL